MKLSNYRLFIFTTTLATLIPAQVLAEAGTDTTMEEVVVVGQRAMIENAIARQRDADVVKSIITRDAIGQFPDQNVAESVRRLTGINVLNDQGEGRFIAVRGLDPSLNSASVNGTRLPSPESDSRSVALDVIASELVESIEVIKTLTPDMDADTIGAAIRINTTSAFDALEPFVTMKVEQTYNDLNEEYSPKGSVDFMVPLTDNLGISGGISYSEREFSTDNIEADGWSITDSGIVYAEDLEYRDYDVIRERTGASFSMDYRASDSTTLFARALYSVFDDTEERRRLTFSLDEAPRSGTAETATFFSDDGEIAVERDIKDRFESQEIQSYQFGGMTQTPAWSFEYSLSYSRAEEHEHKTQDPTRFETSFEDPGALALVFNYADMQVPTYTVTNGEAQFLAPATYDFDKMEQVNGRAEDEEWAAQLDIARMFELDQGELEIKFGAKLRQRTKEFDLFLEVFDGFDGDYTLADVAGGQSYGLLDISPLPDLAAVRNFNGANAALFELNELDTAFESAIEDYSVDEDISAGYLMGRWESGPLIVIGGLRIEHTDNDVTANLVELVEEDGVREGIVLTEDTVFVTPNKFKNSYTDWMPSLSVRYEWADDVLLRAGVFRSIVRPNIASLAPRFIVEESDDGEREGEFGNPDLDPFQAWNFDASIEWYFASGAVLQAGVFHKEIEDFIVNVEFDQDDAPYLGFYNSVAFNEAIIPQNGNDATVTGIELNYQQALINLPGIFSGLLVGLNYTYTDATGDLGTRDIPLPSASENNFNAMLGYEKGPVSVRLTAAYRDNYLKEVGDSADEDRYIEDHLQWDLTASFSVTDNVRLYAQFVNLNDEPYVAYQSGPGSNRLLQYEEYSWTGKFGLQATF